MHALIALIAGFTAKAAVKVLTVTEGANWN